MNNNNENRILVNDVIEATTDTNTIILEWNDLSIYIKPLITVNEMAEMSAAISTAVCDGSKEEYAYRPEFYDFIKRIAMLSYYTNISVPEDLDLAYRLVYTTDIYDKVLEQVCKSQLEQVFDGADKMIESELQAMVSAIATGIKQIETNITNLSNTFKTAFGGVEPEALSNIIQMFGEGKIDEEELLKSISKK